MLHRLRYNSCVTQSQSLKEVKTLIPEISPSTAKTKLQNRKQEKPAGWRGAAKWQFTSQLGSAHSGGFIPQRWRARATCIEHTRVVKYIKQQKRGRSVPGTDTDSETSGSKTTSQNHNRKENKSELMWCRIVHMLLTGSLRGGQSFSSRGPHWVKELEINPPKWGSKVN